MGTGSETPLEIPVFCDGAYKPFGEITAAQARSRSEELAEVGAWGPLAKVAGVAHAWRELAVEMREAGAASVGDLDLEVALGYARRLWVVPPHDSLL
jgi:hypothetical protein